VQSRRESRADDELRARVAGRTQAACVANGTGADDHLGAAFRNGFDGRARCIGAQRDLDRAHAAGGERVG
jgi:hypothetical protein